jgi:membrane protease subunit HflC
MNQRAFAVGGLITLAVIIVGFSCIYILDETKQAFITQLGKVVKQEKEPGLKFKTPLIQKVHLFDKRYLEWDGHRSQVTTGDQRFIEIDTYARWRILEAKAFFEKVKDESGARTRLDDILDGAARKAIADHPLAEIVRSEERKDKKLSAAESEKAEDEGGGSGKGANVLQTFDVGRLQISREILSDAKPTLADFGIELMDFRFKRINYAQVDQAKIFDRMIASQEEKVAEFTGKGKGEALKIGGLQQLEQETIKSEAERQVREIHGEADAEAARIYTEAYNQSDESREFYEFIMTMDAYKTTINQNDWLIFSTQSEFFNYLKRSTKKSE